MNLYPHIIVDLNIPSSQHLLLWSQLWALESHLFILYSNLISSITYIGYLLLIQFLGQFVLLFISSSLRVRARKHLILMPLHMSMKEEQIPSLIKKGVEKTLIRISI